MALRARILGAAAGGGLPQWNCGCANCNAARAGKIPSQTQSSLAVSSNTTDWAILNASPDIRTQIADNDELHPTGARVSPIKSVLVTNGDIDHVAGLLILREKQAFNLFMTREIAEVIAENPIFNALDPDYVDRRIIALEEPFELVTGLTATLFPVPGKVPLYLEGEEVITDLEGEQTVGVHLQSDDSSAFYIPGCARLTPALENRLNGASTIFFDGTVWQDNEMITTGVGQKTGGRMGHMSMAGPDGSIAAFADLGIEKRIYVHMNNTNPVHQPNSPERQQAEAAGWVIGQDGMEFSL